MNAKEPEPHLRFGIEIGDIVVLGLFELHGTSEEYRMALQEAKAFESFDRNIRQRFERPTYEPNTNRTEFYH